VEAVWSAAGELVSDVRRGQPAFLRVEVRRPEGHLLDEALLRPLRDPPGQAREVGGPLISAVERPGTRPPVVARGLGDLARRFLLLASDRAIDHDPLPRLRRRLEPATARPIEERVGAEIEAAVRDVGTEVAR
jgi:hypothetical protein